MSILQNTRKTKVVELSSGTHRVPEEIKKHYLSDEYGGQYSTNLDRNRYGSDDNYLFTVIRYDLDFLGLCPLLIDVEIVDVKAHNSSTLVTAGEDACKCKEKMLDVKAHNLSTLVTAEEDACKCKEKLCPLLIDVEIVDVKVNLSMLVTAGEDACKCKDKNAGFKGTLFEYAGDGRGGCVQVQGSDMDVRFYFEYAGGRREDVCKCQDKHKQALPINGQPNSFHGFKPLGASHPMASAPTMGGPATGLPQLPRANPLPNSLLHQLSSSPSLLPSSSPHTLGNHNLVESLSTMSPSLAHALAPSPRVGLSAGLQDMGLGNPTQPLLGIQSMGLSNPAQHVSGMPSMGYGNPTQLSSGMQSMGLSNPAQPMLGMQSIGFGHPGLGPPLPNGGGLQAVGSALGPMGFGTHLGAGPNLGSGPMLGSGPNLDLGVLQCSAPPLARPQHSADSSAMYRQAEMYRSAANAWGLATAPQSQLSPKPSMSGVSQLFDALLMATAADAAAAAALGGMTLPASLLVAGAASPSAGLKGVPHHPAPHRNISRLWSALSFGADMDSLQNALDNFRGEDEIVSTKLALNALDNLHGEEEIVSNLAQPGKGTTSSPAPANALDNFRGEEEIVSNLAQAGKGTSCSPAPAVGGPLPLAPGTGTPTGGPEEGGALPPAPRVGGTAGGPEEGGTAAASDAAAAEPSGTGPEGEVRVRRRKPLRGNSSFHLLKSDSLGFGFSGLSKLGSLLGKDESGDLNAVCSGGPPPPAATTESSGEVDNTACDESGDLDAVCSGGPPPAAAPTESSGEAEAGGEVDNTAEKLEEAGGESGAMYDQKEEDEATQQQRARSVPRQSSAANLSSRLTPDESIEANLSSRLTPDESSAPNLASRLTSDESSAPNLASRLTPDESSAANLASRLTPDEVRGLRVELATLRSENRRLKLATAGGATSRTDLRGSGDNWMKACPPPSPLGSGGGNKHLEREIAFLRNDLAQARADKKLGDEQLEAFATELTDPVIHPAAIARSGAGTDLGACQKPTRGPPAADTNYGGLSHLNTRCEECVRGLTLELAKSRQEVHLLLTRIVGGSAVMQAAGLPTPSANESQALASNISQHLHRMYTNNTLKATLHDMQLKRDFEAGHHHSPHHAPPEVGQRKVVVASTHASVRQPSGVKVKVESTSAEARDNTSEGGPDVRDKERPRQDGKNKKSEGSADVRHKKSEGSTDVRQKDKDKKSEGAESRDKKSKGGESGSRLEVSLTTNDMTKLHSEATTAGTTTAHTADLAVQPTAATTAHPTAELRSVATTAGAPSAQCLLADLAVQPTAASTAHPTAVLAGQPTAATTAQPTADLAGQPTAATTAQPTADLAVQPTAATTTHPKADLAVQPTTATTAHPTADLAGQPTAATTAQPTADLAVQPTAATTTSAQARRASPGAGEKKNLKGGGEEEEEEAKGGEKGRSSPGVGLASVGVGVAGVGPAGVGLGVAGEAVAGEAVGGEAVAGVCDPDRVCDITAEDAQKPVPSNAEMDDREEDNSAAQHAASTSPASCKRSLEAGSEREAKRPHVL
eukprot:gene31965-33892_t